MGSRGLCCRDLSVQEGKISVMDATSVVMLITGLLFGLLLGAVASWMIRRARADTSVAQLESVASRQRGDLAQAQAAASAAQAEAARARADTSQARADMQEARTEAAETMAAMAQVRADGAQARAQRDAALDRAKELAADRESMLNQFKVVSSETIDKQSKQADASAEARLKATEQLMAPVRESLDKFNARLTDVEKERVRLATDLRNQVQAVQFTGEQLRRETSALATALRKPHVRGAWGEMQLKRVVELAGMVEHCDFTQQHTTTNDDKAIRPDLRVDLSDGKCLFVDAKVPLSAFLDAHEADDDRVRDDAMIRFAANVRTHIDQLGSKKYWQAEAHTPEFVVLFMPSEALAAEAFQVLPDLHEYAAHRDIVLATPTTLIAMLRAVSYGWKQAKLADNAAEVLQLGRGLHRRLSTMGGHFDKLGRALSSATNAYNSTLSSLETRVMVSARRFRDLDVTGDDLVSISPVEDASRPLGDVDLVEDAVQVEPMIGRRRRRNNRDLPESDELVRSEPDLFQLTSGQDEPDEHLPTRRLGS